MRPAFLCAQAALPVSCVVELRLSCPRPMVVLRVRTSEREIETMSINIAAQQAAIRTMRPQISWTFTGNTHVDELGRCWHEATANGTPVWSHAAAEHVISCYDQWEIDENAKREPREATAEELQNKLDILEAAGDIVPLRATGRVITLQTSETALPIKIHVYRNVETGETSYIRGWRDSQFRIWTSFAHSLDFWA